MYSSISSFVTLIKTTIGFWTRASAKASSAE